jgi:hypothetical protein
MSPRQDASEDKTSSTERLANDQLGWGRPHHQRLRTRGPGVCNGSDCGMCHRGLRKPLVCEKPYLQPLIVKQAVVLFKICTIGWGRRGSRARTQELYLWTIAKYMRRAVCAELIPWEVFETLIIIQSRNSLKLRNPKPQISVSGCSSSSPHTRSGSFQDSSEYYLHIYLYVVVLFMWIIQLCGNCFEMHWCLGVLYFIILVAINYQFLRRLNNDPRNTMNYLT